MEDLTMGNSTSLVSKFQEFSGYVVNHGLNNSPEFMAIHKIYTGWYESNEDDGTKIPKEGMTKYQAGVDLYRRIEDQLTEWNKKEVNTMEEVEVKVPFGARVIIGSAIVGHTTGKALNTVATKVIAPAAKATGKWVATDGKAGVQTIGNATKAGFKAFWAGLKNK